MSVFGIEGFSAATSCPNPRMLDLEKLAQREKNDVFSHFKSEEFRYNFKIPKSRNKKSDTCPTPRSYIKI